jgi:hypothetical protein
MSIKKEKQGQYSFILPIDSLPKLKPRGPKKTADTRLAYEEFKRSGVKIAIIPIPEGKKPRSLLVGLGRVLATEKNEDILVRETLDGKVVMYKK